MKWKAYLPEDMEVAEGEEAIIHQMKRKRKIDRSKNMWQWLNKRVQTTKDNVLGMSKL